MQDTRRGFTIVELLIVIVVIGILAAITIVAYNGIQNRSNNSKTVSALGAYAKAISLYKVDNGIHPQVSSCLGVGYTNGKCRTDNNWVENGNNFNTAILEPYLKGATPTPALVPVAFNSSLTITGAFYVYNDVSYNSSGGGIGAITLGTAPCPAVSGLGYVSSATTIDGNMFCRYKVND
jgi:prepilin-type N-terminal cleavage/methylation domain-containing protein